MGNRWVKGYRFGDWDVGNAPCIEWKECEGGQYPGLGIMVNSEDDACGKLVVDGDIWADGGDDPDDGLVGGLVETILTHRIGWFCLSFLFLFPLSPHNDDIYTNYKTLRNLVSA